MKKSLFTAFAVGLCITANVFLPGQVMAQNFNWVKQVSGTSVDWGEAIETDPTGNLVLSGGFFGTVDLDTGNGSFNVTAVGSQDIYLAKYNSYGDFIWGKSIGGSNAERADNGLKVDSNGNIYICGFF